MTSPPDQRPPTASDSATIESDIVDVAGGDSKSLSTTTDATSPIGSPVLGTTDKDRESRYEDSFARWLQRQQDDFAARQKKKELQAAASELASDTAKAAVGSESGTKEGAAASTSSTSDLEDPSPDPDHEQQDSKTASQATTKDSHSGRHKSTHAAPERDTSATNAHDEPIDWDAASDQYPDRESNIGSASSPPKVLPASTQTNQTPQMPKTSAHSSTHKPEQATTQSSRADNGYFFPRPLARSMSTATQPAQTPAAEAASKAPQPSKPQSTKPPSGIAGFHPALRSGHRDAGSSSRQNSQPSRENAAPSGYREKSSNAPHHNGQPSISTMTTWEGKSAVTFEQTTWSPRLERQRESAPQPVLYPWKKQVPNNRRNERWPKPALDPPHLTEAECKKIDVKILRGDILLPLPGPRCQEPDEPEPYQEPDSRCVVPEVGSDASASDGPMSSSSESTASTDREPTSEDWNRAPRVSDDDRMGGRVPFPGFSFSNFSDSDVAQRIFAWRRESEAQWDRSFVVPIHFFGYHTIDNVEIVCWRWIPDRINNVPRDKFFANHLRSRWATECGVTTSDMPWWKMIIDCKTLHLMHPYEQLETKVDPRDSHFLQARSPKNTSEYACEQAMERLEAVKLQKRTARKAKKQEQDDEIEQVRRHFDSMPAAPPNRNAPKANIYLRPGLQTDLAQVDYLYGHYVANTVYTLEMGTSTDRASRIFHTIGNQNLPFFVAVLRGKAKGARNSSLDPETIVGFGFATPHLEMWTSFRQNLDVSIFVHPKYQGQGIGNCLMDRLLWSLDPTYMLKGGYLWDYDRETGRWKNRSSYEVINIFARVLFESDHHTATAHRFPDILDEPLQENVPPEEQIRKRVITAWLAKWGFHKVGETLGMGNKQLVESKKLTEFGEAVYRYRIGPRHGAYQEVPAYVSEQSLSDFSSEDSSIESGSEDASRHSGPEGVSDVSST